jgi:hypothetical protein
MKWSLANDGLFKEDAEYREVGQGGCVMPDRVRRSDPGSYGQLPGFFYAC